MRRAGTLCLVVLFGCQSDGGPGGPGGPGGKADGEDGTYEALMSPKPWEQSHLQRIVDIVDGADDSLDIAMYSYSDARIQQALERAVDRGVKVRFIFETGLADNRLLGDAKTSSKSGRLEQIGVNVRFVNKIMHHKLVIADGPRDDLERAATAIIATGSANWSNSAATQFDENTVVISGWAELALRMQREFDLLWAHSRDFVVDATLPYELSTVEIGEDDVELGDDLDAVFTSSNFTVSGTTFRVTGANTVADLLVGAIQGAERSIWIASGHLRSRAVSEALMARKAADPDLDIRVYLDGQEYISDWTHDTQVDELEACLAAAGTSESARRACLDRGFLFGYQVGQAGIPVRYKYYAYRWDHAYAPQMHHKYFIVDGETLYSGSYNLSDNAEHNTFENMIVYRSPRFAPLVRSFEANFEAIWETGRDRYDAFLASLDTADPVPLVFDPMALEWGQVNALKAEIAANCAAVNSEEYRTNPTAHRVCPRP
jgi:phosphatidylserine/phosphatidylglycerophosphate/cardiolipin synthase-like enzyme